MKISGFPPAPKDEQAKNKIEETTKAKNIKI